MSCPTCGETKLKKIGGHSLPAEFVHWCTRCGTLILIGGDIVRPRWMRWPATVKRAEALADIKRGEEKPDA